MNRWNNLMANHFGGCVLIAEGFDAHRERPARAFIVPGDPENFGISDGVDAWVIPVAAGAGGSIFKGVDLRDLVRKHFAGDHYEVARVGRPRRRISFDDDPPAPPAAPQRRAIAFEDQPQPSTRRRNVAF